MSFVEEIPNNLSQDETVEVHVKKTRGKGKVYLPYCSFRDLDTAKKHLAHTFANNEWTCKRATENSAGDVIWYQCTKCAVRLKLFPGFNDTIMIEITNEDHDHSKWEERKTNYVIKEPARSKIIEYEKMSK